MPRKCKILPIIAVFLIVFAAGLHGACAQQVTGTPSSDPCAGNSSDGTAATPGSPRDNGIYGNWEADLDNIQLESALDLTTDMEQSMQSVPRIDIRNNYCLGNLTTMFQTIEAMATASNPIPSPMKAITATMIQQIGQQILTVIETQACNFISTTINANLSALEKSALSYLQVCLPLPSHGPYNFVYKFPTKPCNGTNMTQILLNALGPQSGQTPKYGLQIGQ